MLFPTLTSESAQKALAGVGIELTADQFRIEARDERWSVYLPGERMAWFAASDDGRQRLDTERRLFKLLASRCSFRIPRVLIEDESGDLDVRAMVPGSADAQRLYKAICGSAEIASRVGSALGAILAEQHTRIRAVDVRGWLRERLTWPESRAWIRERLPQVVEDSELIAAADKVIEKYESVCVAEDDRALIHGDVGLHNLSVDPVSHTLNGIFDYEGAAWADRHHDFQYLVLDTELTPLLDAAVSVYEAATGFALQRDRINLYNAACAITYLAFRLGKAPRDPWCGRTLAEDLRWTRLAIEQVA